MRLEGGGGLPLSLIAPRADLGALDHAFRELLTHASVDDWHVRLGASREEVAAVWTGVAGARHDRVPGDGGLAVTVSERAIEVLEAVVFELARARRVPASELVERTGTPLDEWRRLHGELLDLVVQLDMDHAAPHVAPPVALPDGAADLSIQRFRHAGFPLVAAHVSSVALECGDARNIRIERSAFEDVVCRDVRLISSRLSDVDASGAFERSAVIDCVVEDVGVSGSLSSVDFVGGAFSEFHLGSAVLVDCRFFEAFPGDGVSLPSGRDCFVVPVASVERAFEPLRPRLGTDTYQAIEDWARHEEADYVSVVPAFWRTQMLARGAHDDDEVEHEVMDRLFRLRVRSLAAGAPR